MTNITVLYFTMNNIFLKLFILCIKAVFYPLPVRSELGGGFCSLHTKVTLPLQRCSSKPSSQSWSPLHTKDGLMHWPINKQINENCKLTANCPHKFKITDRSDLPDVQRNLFLHPACRGQVFFGEQGCLWMASPVQELPPNWGNVSTGRIRTWEKTPLGGQSFSRGQ